MTRGQKIVVWIFGLLISFVLYVWGLNMNYPTINAFVAFILPLLIIGGLFFFSFGKKKD